MKNVNIFGDIAGRFDEFQQLESIMPEADLNIWVGDLHDRGQKSRQMIEYAMKKDGDKYITLHSNHADLFVDFMKLEGRYEIGLFLHNGGMTTLQSYGYKGTDSLPDWYYEPEEFAQVTGDLRRWALKNIPAEHIKWLETRPYYYEQEGLFVSHAARNPCYKLEQLCFTGVGKSPFYDKDHSLLWNRGSPRRIKDKNGNLIFQVYGHDSCLFWHTKKTIKGKDQEKWAVCIDDSGHKKLTGINYPSKQIFQVEYK